MNGKWSETEREGGEEGGLAVAASLVSGIDERKTGNAPYPDGQNHIPRRHDIQHRHAVVSGGLHSSLVTGLRSLNNLRTGIWQTVPRD